ncbi:MAG TPA: hypothetical protein VGO11_11005 [Chthoniobacteraceae bacterium]|jgi:hypothetical protein|nr:hypothetical protein [Chthoniobacteraceae bacterium]
MRITRYTTFEVLEARIAPAAFYVSGTSLEIDNASGVAQGGDSAAATAAGADKTILLHAGDRLYFNPDGVVGTHATDKLWVSVTASNALVFFKDINGDQRFSLDELSGLAVGDRFSGSVFSDLHGSVATMLDRDGHFAPGELQRASISRLSVTGALVSATDGYTNILAGVGISNLTVLGQSLANGLSVNGLVATGSQALNLSWGFGGPAAPFDPATFQHVIGTSGGDVIHAHFSGGLRGILTGDGEETPHGLRGSAGSGGSIVDVTMGISPEGFLLQTGKGGNVGSAPGPAIAGAGGAGGGIIGVRVAFHSSVTTYPKIVTGAGGFGIGAHGGAGGSIINSSFRDLDPALSFLMQTGDGGAGDGSGNGGAGGSIVNTSLILLGDLGTTVMAGGAPHRSGGDLDIVLGSGGAVGTEHSHGGHRPIVGAGGSWDWFSTTKNSALQQALSGGTNAAITTQGLAAFHLTAGGAGLPGAPGFNGTGGSILGGRFDFRGALGILGDGEFTVTSGSGSDSSSFPGAAGRFEGAVFSFGGPVQFDHGDFRVTAGSGGRLVDDPGSLTGGRDGGALNRLVFDFHDLVAIGGAFSFTAGEGGLDGGILGDAGNGGPINGLAILSTKGIAATLSVSSGQGGVGGTFAPSGATGAGGDVSNLLIQAPSLGGLQLASGDGGFQFGSGDGARGGDFSTGVGLIPHPAVDAGLAARLHTPAGVYISRAVGSVEVHLGAGASGGGSSGRGGLGGSLLDSRFVFGSVADDLLVSGGGGGAGKGHRAGGRSGGIDHASFQVGGNVGGDVRIALDHGGDSGEFASTGSGGNYSYLALDVGGNVTGTLAIFAPRAGDIGTRIGGSGGSLDHLHLNVGDILGGSLPPPEVPFGPAKYSLQISAGRGEGAAKGGVGGGISDSFIGTKTLTFGAYILTGDGGDSEIYDAGAGGSFTSDTFVFGGNIGGNLEVHAGRGGTTQGRGAAARGGSIVSTDLTLQAAVDVNVFAGPNGTSRRDGVTGGAIFGLTLENTGPVRNVMIEAGGGTVTAFGVGQAGAGGPIVGSTYSNHGGAEQVTVMAGDGGALLGETPFTRGSAGPGGTLAGFTFNNAAPLGTAQFVGGAGGAVQISGENARGAGGRGGWVTGFTLHDSAGADSLTYLRGGAGGTGVGEGLRGAAGGAVLQTRLDTDAVVLVTGGQAGEFSEYHDHTVGGFGGSVRGITGRVGHLSVIAGNAGSGTVGGWGGDVSGVVLSEVSGFVRLLQGGSGGSGVLVAGLGGSVSGIIVPGDIGDFHSAFASGIGNLGLAGMGGLVAGQGGPRDAVFAGPAGRISNVTANRIAAIYASEIGFDGEQAVASITGVRAGEIGADTGLPGTNEVPGLRGYGTYTYNSSGGRDTPVDGPVIVRASGYTPHSLSVVPLFLLLVPG